MNVDYILDTLNRQHVAYLLMGGMNFLMRHAPVLTFDIDLWIEDTAVNLERCEHGLAELNAAWGSTETDWGPVAQRPAGWLKAQPVFCLTSPYGAIDIFREVRGLDNWPACRVRAVPVTTSAGIHFHGLCDEDMLCSQLALDHAEQKPDRIRTLKTALQRKP